MILGNVCTRQCTFCAVNKGMPLPLDPDEPEKLAEAAKKLSLRHVVITSVTRDDLEDGGAGVFRECVLKVKELLPDSTVEVLTPDFKGSKESLEIVLSSKPDVFNHNIETVPRLYGEVRPQANYETSLHILSLSKKIYSNITAKSGLMVGLGETQDEIFSSMDDLRKADCDILTIGQYLSPTPKHHPVVEFIRPETFEIYKNMALKKGFSAASCGTFVRSSYHAEEVFSESKV